MIQKILGLAWVSLIITFMMTVGGCSRQSTETKGMQSVNNTFTIVAHRGFSAIAPENTLIAMEKAVEIGADGCETDVFRCKTGEIVLSHDNSAKRTTGVDKHITDMTFEEVEALDAGSWKGPQFKGERIPTLQAYLKLLKDAHCHAVVEIKMEGITRQVLDIIKAEGMFENTTVIAFSGNVIREVRAMEPDISCAWLYSEELKGTEEERAKIIVEKVRATNAHIIDIAHTMLTKAILAELHKQGILVWAWTVDDPARMKELLEWGLDSITTNRPDLALEVRKNAK
jgi:glycerophosphoryl diester phosphodiesterase